MKAKAHLREATVADLYAVREDGKAEIVNGELVQMSPTGAAPGRAGGEVYASLRLYERQTGSGYAFPDNVGFVVNLPHRASFSPDAAFYTGKWTGMKFLEGAPIFAVGIRGANDYGPAAEQALAEKRADYFAAGTQVVWDVDLQGTDVIRAYRASDPDNPTLYRRGDVADAEPAVPGWKMPVDDLFL
jgi:Uma2 family endonuclease